MYNERCKISIRKYFHKKKKKNIRIGKDDIATPHQLHTKRSRVRSPKFWRCFMRINGQSSPMILGEKKLTVRSTILLLEVDARFIVRAILVFYFIFYFYLFHLVLTYGIRF